MPSWLVLLALSVLDSVADDVRGCLGTVYQITADFLAERKVLAEVKSNVSPETRKLLDKPPFAFAWQPSAPLEEIERVLYKMPEGRTLCATCAPSTISAA